MSYMDRENILSEGVIDTVIKHLIKKGRRQDAVKIKNNKKIQKDLIKLQKKVDDMNKGAESWEKLFGKGTYTKKKIEDYI